MNSTSDRGTWRRFTSIAKPFFVSEMRWKARGMICLLCMFALSVTGLNVVLSFVGRDFMTALALKQKDEFFYQLTRYLLTFAAATPVIVFYHYTEERLGLMWREWLSLRMVKMYFSNRAYYQINTEGLLDNPDQRIESDVRTFTALSLSFLLILLNSVIALFAFMGILWSISSTLTFAAIGYAALGSLITYLLGRPLIGLNFAQLKKDADYRYKLINVRDNAESIAFYRAEGKELTRVRQRLRKALTNFKQIINRNRNLGFFTTGYNYVVTILPTIIVAPLYLDGKIELGVVTQAGIAFGQVLGALSIIVTNFGGLSTFAAVIRRLGAFSEIVSHADGHHFGAGSTIKYFDGSTVEYRDVTILTPQRRQLIVNDLSLKLNDGEALLISGGSGTGKSSVLRGLSGLWTNGSGSIVRPPLHETFFFPQRPYMVLGSLRSQLLYSARRKGVTDRVLIEIINQVDLESMLERVGGLDAQLDWANILSTGEQQRLAFARFMLSGCCYAFLDEATTALDGAGEEKLYKILKKQVRTFVSVGHKGDLARFHQVILELQGGGEWRYDRL